MIRVDPVLRDRLREYAATEGRTLEWSTNKAIEEFLMAYGPSSAVLPDKAETDKWGAKIITLKKNTPRPQAVKLEMTPYPSPDPELIITERNKDMEFCKHGAVKGMCKKGCK